PSACPGAGRGRLRGQAVRPRRAGGSGARRARASCERRTRATQSRALGARVIADAAPSEHAKAARRPRFTMHWGKAMAVALGAPALVTLLAFTNVRTVVPGLLYVVAIILATFVGGRIGGLVAVAASVFPFFYFFASRYD